MRKVKYFGDDDWEQFKEEFEWNGSEDLYYTSSSGTEYGFTIWEDGMGCHIRYNDELKKGGYINDIGAVYQTLEEMIDGYVMPDGVTMKEVWNGENYRFD